MATSALFAAHVLIRAVIAQKKVQPATPTFLDCLHEIATMHMRILLAAAGVLAISACADEPTGPRPAPRGLASVPTQAPLGSVSYIASFDHTVLPLLPNVQANLSNAFGNGINHAGDVAGYVEGYFDGHFFSVARATVWTSAGAQNLGTLPPGSPSQKSYATDINDAGAVTGWGTTHGSTGICCGVGRGFKWTSNGGMQPLVPPTPSDNVITRGFAINSMGHIAGVVIDGNAFYAAIWFDPAVPPVIIAAAGPSAMATDINDLGQVVGSHAGGAFVWSAQDGVTFLPSLGGWTVATAINNYGVVVGFSELPDGTQHPFRWTPSGGMEDLGLPPGVMYAQARAVTKSDRIVVTTDFIDPNTAAILSRAFLWADGQWIDLSPAGFGSSYGVSINENLQIAGSGISAHSSGHSALRWDVTLTPASPTFAFTGFFAPIQNLPIVNQVKAGQGIPVKFSLGGDHGLDIFAAGYPASQPIACDGSAPVDDVDTTVSAGGSSLSYDAVSGVYTYVWKTEKSWAGTCHRLTVKLTDGTERSAHFRFVR